MLTDVKVLVFLLLQSEQISLPYLNDHCMENLQVAEAPITFLKEISCPVLAPALPCLE